MELFYNENISKKTLKFRIEGNENNHIINVLRKKEGDVLMFTNGKNYRFQTEIINLSKKTSELRVLSCEKFLETDYLHIGISILKSPSRFEIFLEKAVEIGINEITPIICKKTFKKNIKMDRCKKLIISAAKQSIKYQLPKLNNPVSFDNFIKSTNEKNRLIATCEELKKDYLSESFDKSKTNVLLIGPEGDFTKDELNKAGIHNFKYVSLGDTRLRAETAGIVSCAIFSMI
tara:strand:- start:46 stop:741 length:696 start_codon:yes stop_codon:yes gene_type:complete